MLLDAGEIIAHLQARLKTIARVREHIAKRVQPPPQSVELNSKLTQQSEATGLRVNPPKLQLPTFDGNIQQ